MILYFSAEGNSKEVAMRLGEILQDKVESIISIAPDKIKFEGESLGIVFPIYSWGVPPIMLNYIKSLSEEFTAQVGNKGVWMVCTCGDDIGMAPEILKKAIEEKRLDFKGGWSITMPNTYVLLPGFNVDSHELEEKKLRASTERIRDIGKKIKSGTYEEDYVRGLFPRFKTKILLPLFQKWGISPSRWKYTVSCVGCGLCEKSCQVGNIKMVNDREGRKRPQWGDNCISCVACYHVCPRHAIEYGNITKGKGQYLNPLMKKDNTIR